MFSLLCNPLLLEPKKRSGETIRTTTKNMMHFQYPEALYPTYLNEQPMFFQKICCWGKKAQQPNAHQHGGHLDPPWRPSWWYPHRPWLWKSIAIKHDFCFRKMDQQNADIFSWSILVRCFLPCLLCPDTYQSKLVLSIVGKQCTTINIPTVRVEHRQNMHVLETSL